MGPKRQGHTTTTTTTTITKNLTLEREKREEVSEKNERTKRRFPLLGCDGYHLKPLMQRVTKIAE